MADWLYVASNARACVADTRNLALRHGLIWHAKPADPRPLPGDRLLLCFRVNSGDLVALAFCEIAGGASRLNSQCDRVAKKNPTYVEEIWPTVWDDFERARPGRPNGTGYRANSAKRALAVQVIDALSDAWADPVDAFTAPAAALISIDSAVEEEPETLREIVPGAKFGGPLGPAVTARLDRR